MELLLSEKVNWNQFRIPFHLVQMTIFNNLSDNKCCWQGCGERAPLLTIVRLQVMHLEITMKIPKKEQLQLLSETVVTLLCVCLTGCEATQHRGTCTSVATAASFTVARKWHHPRCVCVCTNVGHLTRDHEWWMILIVMDYRKVVKIMW